MNDEEYLKYRRAMVKGNEHVESIVKAIDTMLSVSKLKETMKYLYNLVFDPYNFNN